MKQIAKLFGWVIVAALLIAVFFGTISLTKLISTPFTLVTRTLDAENIVYNYEWFKRQYNEIGAFSRKIDSANLQLDALKSDPNDSFEYKQEIARVRSVILGLQNQQAGMIADYNAKSQMVNRSIFKTGDLPESL